MRPALLTIVTLIALSAVGCVALGRPDIPYATLQARYANTASRFMDMPGGVRVHYRDQGDPDGPAVVLLHGFSASLEAWEPWVREPGLAGYRLISLDLPGHGLTQAPRGYRGTLDGYADLADAVAARLGVPRYVVAGNSMGGAVAWNLAMRRPDHVRGLVLIDAAGWPGSRSGPPAAAALLNNPVGRSLIRGADPRPFASRGLRLAYHDPALVTPALVDRYVDLARAPGHREILATQQSRPGVQVTAASFARVRIPTLVMHGEADRLIPPADGRAFAGAIPGARLVTYPGVGHVPMEQIPTRSAADLRSFLADLPP